MHKRLIEEGFNRRYVLLPLLLSIALVALGYWITEARRIQARQLADVVRERQDVIRLLTEAGYKAMEAESAQRGFLLTGEEKYLPPLETGLAAARAAARGAARALCRSWIPRSCAVLDSVSEDLGVKADEMRRSVALAEGRQAARSPGDLVKSDLGLYQMFAISQALESLRTQERQKVLAGLDDWQRHDAASTPSSTPATWYSPIGILLILGLLATRDIRRRARLCPRPGRHRSRRAPPNCAISAGT